MKLNQIIEIDRIRQYDYWNNVQFDIDWTKHSNNARTFATNNPRAMNSTKDTYPWLKEHFGISLLPTQIYEYNLRMEGRMDEKEITESIERRYVPIYGQEPRLSTVMS